MASAGISGTPKWSFASTAIERPWPRASSNVSDLFNQTNTNYFNRFASQTAALSRMEVDSTLFTRWEGTITDTNDIRPRGFDAELIFNPTRA